MRIPSTAWSDLRRAGGRSSGAWRRLYDAYRAPVRGRICFRIRGISEEDADDLTQTVFLHLSSGGLLGRLDPAKGRFRDLLRAITDHVVGQWLRGEYSRRRKGDRAIVSLEEAALPAATPDDDSFDRSWARNIVERSLESLRRESERLDTPYHAALVAFYFEEDSYAQIARRLKITEIDVGNLVARGRRKLASAIEAHVREYCRTAEEFQEEMTALRAFLPGGA